MNAHLSPLEQSINPNVTNGAALPSTPGRYPSPLEPTQVTSSWECGPKSDQMFEFLAK